MAIKKGVADSDTAFEMMGTETIRYWYWFSNYVSARRELLGKPYLKELQELIHEDWAQRKDDPSKRPAKPIETDGLSLVKDFLRG